MFKFITNRIKFNKIVKRQFNQHIIFIAHDIAMDYFEKVMSAKPNITNKFEVNFEVSENKEVLIILLNIDDNRYELHINTKAESASYFINILEAIYSFKSWDSLVYVSATENPNDYIHISFSPTYFRFIAVLNAHGEPKYIDTLIEGIDIIDKLVVPLIECEPFGKYMLEAKKLHKYSPKKVKLPLWYSVEELKKEYNFVK